MAEPRNPSPESSHDPFDLQWRARLRDVVAGWDLAPEDQAGIVDELEQHLEQELAELTPRIGAEGARERIVAQVNDPQLQQASVRPRHQPPASVAHSRSQAQAEPQSHAGAHARSRARDARAFLRDVRYGWRALRTSPRTTIMAGIALALGIGLTTMMFTIIYGLLIRGLPFAQADRIAIVMEANPSEGEPELSLPMRDYVIFRDAQRSFETFGAWQQLTVNVAGNERPERVTAARMTVGAMQVPRVLPMLGRIFSAGEDSPGAPLVVLLSHSLWRDRYASDSAVVGRAVRINGIPATVIGVMPDGFGFPREPRLWVPLRLDSVTAPYGSGQRVNGVARLRDGVTFDQANADLAVIARRIEMEHRDTNKGVVANAQPFIRATLPARLFALLYAMFGAVAMVFLVACTNVANLLLARAAHRSKEVAIRIAMGASRGAIVRQFLVEALVLSMVSAGVGALIAWGGLAAFWRAVADDVPFWTDFRLHPQVFAFIAVTALVASVVAGLLPALTAARSEITDVLKDKSFGSSSLRSGRLSRALVVFELALSSALLVVAAMITRSVVNLRSLEPGFRTAGIMTGQVTLSPGDRNRQRALVSRLDAEVARIHGAVATTLSTSLPGPGWSGREVAMEGASYPRANSWPTVRHIAVTPGFFTTFEIPLLRGRPIGEGDRADALPVAVVNQRFVDRFFPNADPLGRRFNMSPRDSVGTWVTIVGVMRNLYAADQGSLDRNTPWPAEVLTSFRQQVSGSATISIRTDGDPNRVVEPLRAIVAELDPDLPVYSLTSMDDVLAKSRWGMIVFGGLFVVFGVVALALASIGLYAVLAFTVSRREKEMGIRMALGAQAADVVRLVLMGAAWLMVLGIPIGVFAGVNMARLAHAVLFEVKPNDPVMLAIIVGTLTATGIAASIAPAWRATKSDPVGSLRAE